MIEKLAYLWPEITLFVTTCVVMVLGQSRSFETRRLTAGVAGAGVIVAGLLAANTPADPSSLFPQIMPYAKGLIAIIGLMILCLLAGTIDRDYEALIKKGVAKFDPLRANRAEFYAFFLFSLTGLMLCASADDLIWLFLALELTSLPTYIMVTISTRGTRSQEAGVKYFFLGALGAAVFLYGFAMLYGATGTTSLPEIADVLAAQSQAGGLNAIAIVGLVVSILGLAFKIAAVPMHFYVADVYQGASASVSAMLAFVPKTAGFLAIISICAAAGWTHGPTGDSLPDALRLVLWVMAALTMTVGNVLALLQNSVKRILAYSSIAHSGYMLVGVIAGPVGPGQENGLAAVLFYLLCYGVMNLGAFAVVASLRKPDGSEIDEVDDLRGLVKTHPMLAWILVLSSVSMLGLPPLLGFFGKLGLFVSGVAAGEIPLVIVLGLNSAIAAFYYLRLVTVPFLDTRSAREGAFDGRLTDVHSRPIAGLLSAGGVVLLAFPFILGTLVNGATEAVSGSVSGSWVGRAESGETLPSPAVDTTEHAEFDASTAVGLADDARP